MKRYKGKTNWTPMPLVRVLLSPQITLLRHRAHTATHTYAYTNIKAIPLLSPAQAASLWRDVSPMHALLSRLIPPGLHLLQKKSCAHAHAQACAHTQGL